MPALKNAKYYNLVNNILLDKWLVGKYSKEVLIDFNKYKTLHSIDLTLIRPERLNATFFYIEKKEHSIYNLIRYLDWLGINLNNEEYNTLYKVLSNNTYKVRDLLIDAFINFENNYFINNVANPILKKLAIDKIKRNKIYNLGLGLKLSVKAFKDDFN